MNINPTFSGILSYDQCTEVLLLSFNCGTLYHQHLVRLKAVALVFVPTPITTAEKMIWLNF